jgi:hypothetical protein
MELRWNSMYIVALFYCEVLFYWIVFLLHYVHYRSKVLEHLLIQGFFFICTIFYIVE